MKEREDFPLYSVLVMMAVCGNTCVTTSSVSSSPHSTHSPTLPQYSPSPLLATGLAEQSGSAPDLGGCMLQGTPFEIFRDTLARGQDFGASFQFNGTFYLVLPNPIITSMIFSGAVYSFSNGNFTLHQHIPVGLRDSSLRLSVVSNNDLVFLFQCGQQFIHVFQWHTSDRTFYLTQVFNDSSIYQNGLCSAFAADGELFLLAVNGYTDLGMHSVVLLQLDPSSGQLSYSSAFDWHEFVSTDATDCHVFTIDGELYAAVSKDSHKTKYTILRWERMLRRFDLLQTLDSSFSVYQSAVVELWGAVYLLAPSEGACRTMLYAWNGTMFEENDWQLEDAFGGGAVFFTLGGGHFLAFGHYDYLGAWSVLLLSFNDTSNFTAVLEIPTTYEAQLFLDFLVVNDSGRQVPLLLLAENGRPALYQLSIQCPSPQPPPSPGFFDIYKIIFITFAGAGFLVLVLAAITYSVIRHRHGGYESIGEDVSAVN